MNNWLPNNLFREVVESRDVIAAEWERRIPEIRALDESLALRVEQTLSAWQRTRAELLRCQHLASEGFEQHSCRLEQVIATSDAEVAELEDLGRAISAIRNRPAGDNPFEDKRDP